MNEVFNTNHMILELAENNFLLVMLVLMFLNGLSQILQWRWLSQFVALLKNMFAFIRGNRDESRKIPAELPDQHRPAG
jgi:hypothetical protein